MPVPGETVLVIASMHAGHRGEASPSLLATRSTIIGDNIGFSSAPTWVSVPRRFGRYLGITDSRIKLGQYIFMRHGAKVVFFGRFFAILRCLAAFLAGVNQLSWPRFLLANAAGAIVWATIFGLGAYLFGRQFTHSSSHYSLGAFALEQGDRGGRRVYLLVAPRSSAGGGG